MSDLVFIVVVTTVSGLVLFDNLSFGAPLETTPGCEVCDSDVCRERADLLKASINESLDPCDDFYSFVCDGWINEHPIPPEQQSYGTFEQTEQSVMHELKVNVNTDLVDVARKYDMNHGIQVKLEWCKRVITEMIENITDFTEPYNVTQKAAVVYRTCLQNNFTDQQLIALWGDLIAGYGFRAWPIVESKDVPYSSYEELLANTSLWPIYSVGVAPDIEDNGRFIIELDEMPFPVLGREHLVNPNATEHNRNVVQSYVYLIATAILILNRYATIPECLGAAEEIFSFESQLAMLTTPPEQARDIPYERLNLEDMEGKLPGLPILESLNQEFSLANITIDKAEQVAIYGMTYFGATIPFLKNQSLASIYNFVVWRRVFSLGLLTSGRFSRAFQELTAVAFGIQSSTERWQYCLGKLADLMPYVIGRLYVQKNFNVNAKNDGSGRDCCFRKSLMPSEIAAAEKVLYASFDFLTQLDKMTHKIGYPEWIYDDEYMESRFRFVGDISLSEPFAVIMTKYGKNSAIMKMLELRSTLNKNTTYVRKKKTDARHSDVYAVETLIGCLYAARHLTNRWAGPSVVNAYYSFVNNEMVFPAAILRDALYKHGLPDSVNYGGIGAVIGHEMIHGFDNSGSQFDEEGRLRNWWTSRTREKFEDRAECFVRQYSAEFSYLANRTLNGVNTLGENIADNGGLRMAYRTLSDQLNESVTPDIRLPGLEKYTSNQLFFISHAFVWCGSVRQEALQLKIEYDKHAPKRHRVNVSLRNMKSFTTAFQCKENSRMHYKNNETCLMW